PLPGKPALDITPASLTFAAQNVGSASGAQTVNLVSIGTAPVTIRSVTLSGVNASDFKITAGEQVGTVAEGTRRAVSIRFAPTAAGARSATLVVSSNVTGSPHKVPLSGTGIAAAAAPLVAGDWPQAAHDPRHLGLADGALDLRGLMPWSLPLGLIPGSAPVA